MVCVNFLTDSCPGVCGRRRSGGRRYKTVSQTLRCLIGFQMSSCNCTYTYNLFFPYSLFSFKCLSCEPCHAAVTSHTADIFQLCWNFFNQSTDFTKIIFEPSSPVRYTCYYLKVTKFSFKILPDLLHCF